jgi:hypothetical protein
MLIENTHWLDLVMDESEYWPVSGEKMRPSAGRSRSCEQ